MMSVSEANAVHALIRALAGTGDRDGHDAAEALELLHDKAYRVLGVSSTGERLAAAQEFLVGNCEVRS